ncbi:MAG: hypothetical protein U9Q80_09445 [Bacillota bacterium]|nr:hypothetical protein [Bacillota bacterium]
MKKIIFGLIFALCIISTLSFADNYCNYSDQPIEKMIYDEIRNDSIQVYYFENDIENIMKVYESNFEEALFTIASKSFVMIDDLMQVEELVDFLRNNGIDEASYVKLVENDGEYFYYIKSREGIYYLDTELNELMNFSDVVKKYKSDSISLVLLISVLLIAVIYIIEKKRVKNNEHV